MNKNYILALLIGLGIFAACSNNTAQNKNKWEHKGEIKITESDLKPLRLFPTTDKHLSVEVSPDFLEATIKRDGKVFQTVVDEESGLISYGEEAPVHFLDINFDGFTDIFIGYGESRSYSTVLLWNDKTKKFVRIGEKGDPDWQGFMLCPSKKIVVGGGSGSYCSFYMNINHWDGFNFVTDQSLTVITEKSEYPFYEVRNKYTLSDASGKVICSTEKSTGLPSHWQTIVKVYGYE